MVKVIFAEVYFGNGVFISWGVIGIWEVDQKIVIVICDKL